jgi:2-C-methyl-D-erythritol 4-phosphate cytidylyltransferase
VAKAKEMKDQTFTDDASLCEYYGIPVGVFEGDVRNMKLTYGFEMETLKNLLSDRDKEERGAQPCESESATTFTG